MVYCWDHDKMNYQYKCTLFTQISAAQFSPDMMKIKTIIILV